MDSTHEEPSFNFPLFIHLNPDLEISMNYAERIQHLTGSVARDILSRCQDQSIISFAGGLPGREAWQGLDLPKPEVTSFQYGASEGDAGLRALFASRLGSIGVDVPTEQILVTSGSQQGLDLVSKLWIDPESAVAVESPTYLAALQVFRLFQAEMVTIETGPQGLDLERLEHVLKTHRPRFLYLNPTFQNPSGNCYPEDNRREIAAILDCYADHTVLIEDDPYRELNYEREEAPLPIVSHLKTANWVYLGTTSKIIIPGARIGLLAASGSFISELQKLKQAADLHSSRLSQQVVLELLSNSEWVHARMKHLQQVYRVKRNLMHEELLKHANEIAQWQCPQGGMFFWLRLNQRTDLKMALNRCLDRGVAFMPGDPFFAESTEHGQWIRLNFTSPDESDIRRFLPVIFETIGQGE